jgi:hypothetical protein
MHNEIPYLKDIVSIICSLVSPDGIILFGSYARGDNNKENGTENICSINRRADINSAFCLSFL